MATIGFVLSHEQFPQPELLEYGVAAEEAGFDAVWASDHFHPWMDNEGHAGQAWITLAALGQRMPRILMGTGVTCPTYRYRPAIVAQSFASLATLYPGRIFLGVGTGEALNERPASGEWGEYEERAERLVEAIELIRKLWTGDWVSHNGRYYQVEQARLYDAPPQPIPIYVAASGEESMKLAGKHGDGLITDGKSALKQELRDAFAEGARSAGKNVDTMPIIAEHFVVLGGKAEAEQAARLWRFLPNAWSEYVENPDPRDIQRLAEKEVKLEEVYSNWAVSEDADEHAEAIQKLLDGGVTHVFVHAGNADQRRAIAFYGQEVLPRLRGQRTKVRGAS